MWYFLFLTNFATAEIITLLKQTDITCVMTADNVGSAVYLNPPTKAGVLKQKMAEIDNWTVDDWTTVNSVNTNQSFVIDKRWEDFTMLGEDTGYALKDNSLPFSVCVTANFSLNILNSNFLYETWLHITPSSVNFSKNKNSCNWLHYTLTKNGTTVILTSSENVQTFFPLDFDPYWVYIKSPVGDTTFWKLHNYGFKTATTPTKDQESKVSVNFTDNLCLSMYVSVDKNSFLDVILETTENTTRQTIIGFNEKKSLKQWQRIEIEASGFGEGNISFFRGLTEQTDLEGYWAVDKITFCSKNIEIVTASLQDEAPGDYICESLDQHEYAGNTNQNILRCDKAGFLGENCNISCSTVLGSSYPYCENHKICQDVSSCFCSWGYQGKDCSQSCADGTWGLFCKNRCSRECVQKCHPSTGRCLTLETSPPVDTVILVETAALVEEITLTEEDLPVNITITTNKIKIALPNFEKKINQMSYKIKYVCVSFWCRDQVFEDYTIEVVPSQNFMVGEFESFVPLTEYQASVTVQGFNQSLEKRYKIFRTDDVYAVENVSIFSSNSSSLWVRFSVSEVSNVGLPYKIWYQEIDSASRPKSIETVSPCKLWKKFLCARIDNLKKETFYYIMVEHIETQHQKWGLSETMLGYTDESISNAPENLQVLWGSDGNAIVSWNHPIITNGPIQKFVIDVQTIENVKSYTVDVLEPQTVYRYKLSVEYNTQYKISVRVFNKYEGKNDTINATFIPFVAEFSSNGAIILACSETCHMLVPKPETLQDKSNYGIVGILENDTNTNMMKLLNNKINPIEQGWLVLDDIGSYEKYFIADIGTASAEIVSLKNIKNYSLYLVQKNNDNDYSIYPIELLEEKKVDPALITSSVTYISSIAIFSLLLMLLLIILLSRLHRRNREKKNNFHEYRMVEQNHVITRPKVESQEQFTKIKTRFFESFLKNALLTSKDLIAQFRSLPAATRPMVHAFHPKNKNKNKDSENIPYDHNRVVLEKMEGMGGDDYINASYIDGFDRPKTYIATQGPKFYTVRDFWRMIWQEQVETVVMATNFMENRKRKCAEYFPQKCDASFQCGQMMIKLIKEEHYEHHTVRFLEVRYRRSVREIQHFHLRWTPDKFAPLYPNCVVPLIKTISAIRENSNSPILIHCSSGSNRTGTLILCDLALHMANANDSVDFYSILKSMRDQRPNMICSEKQYILAHLIVLEYLMEQENVFKQSLKENLHPSLFKSQLKYLKRLSWHDDVVENWAPRRSDLYNYSYTIYPVDGYAINKKFLTTHLPTKTLLANFWNMIIQERIEIIILLDNYKIWPYQNQNNNTLLTVKKLQSLRTTYCSYTKLSLLVFNLSFNNIIQEQSVDLFEACQTNGFLNILDDINKCNNKQKPILVACHDGVRKCGLFVTLDYIIQKCKNEFEVDVCNGVRNTRRSGLPFVETPAEMEFLYRNSLDYLQQFDEYTSIL